MTLTKFFVKLKSEKMTLKTPHRIKTEARELKIYREYKKLTANPDNAVGAVKTYLMKKYDIAAPSTIWNICKRVEARLGIKES